MKREDKVAKRIEHIVKHLEFGFDLPGLTKNVEHNLGNPRASALSLAAHAEAKAMYAWFEHGELETMRNWMYVDAALLKLRNQIEPDIDSPGAAMLRLLAPLLSNHRPLIDWFAGFEGDFDLSRVDNPKHHDFWAYQAFVALRGDWDRLAQRCQAIIDKPPTSAAETKYFVDHLFYQALAQGDVPQMEARLAELTAAPVVKGRGNDESGFTADLIFTPAVIYAKIAWLHGYQVKVDSPLVPAAWLPMDPLPAYRSPYGFLA
jgi:hypothetical protein